jgi:phage shock protein C
MEAAMAETERRLQKSRTDRMIDGVCGGVAAYFSIDSTLVRVLWVLLTLFGGSGLLLYIAAMIIMPKDESAAPVAPAPPKNHEGNTKFWGILLVAVGAIWLVGNLGFPFWHLWWGFPWHVGVPVLFILAGVAFLFGGRSYVSAQPASTSGYAEPAGEAAAAQAPAQSPARRLYRSQKDKKFMGVCGGIAAHVNVDPVIVRLMFVAGVLMSHGFFVILYIVLGIVLPKEPEAAPAA